MSSGVQLDQLGSQCGDNATGKCNEERCPRIINLLTAQFPAKGMEDLSLGKIVKEKTESATEPRTFFSKFSPKILRRLPNFVSVPFTNVRWSVRLCPRDRYLGVTGGKFMTTRRQTLAMPRHVRKLP